MKHVLNTCKESVSRIGRHLHPGARIEMYQGISSVQDPSFLELESVVRSWRLMLDDDGPASGSAAQRVEEWRRWHLTILDVEIDSDPFPTDRPAQPVLELLGLVVVNALGVHQSQLLHLTSLHFGLRDSPFAAVRRPYRKDKHHRVRLFRSVVMSMLPRAAVCC